ncbi:MAG: diaminopimelate decarboxylase [Firmicutes bacterium]|nr:diaminopimelate decarboxylase [Bacillota bacterium]
MKLHGTMQVNTAGHLEIGGCDTTELVKEFGSPLYVMDESLIRQNCRSYVGSFRAVYPDSEVIYASKVFSTRAICRLMQEEDMGLDVVSAGELYTALSVNFPVNRIYFHGNNKSPQELQMAIEAGVHRIVADSFYELELINSIASGLGKKTDWKPYWQLRHILRWICGEFTAISDRRYLIWNPMLRPPGQ